MDINEKPCGVSIFIYCQLEDRSFRIILCYLLCRNSSISLKRMSFIPLAYKEDLLVKLRQMLLISVGRNHKPLLTDWFQFSGNATNYRNWD